jgi:hypothetical protein
MAVTSAAAPTSRPNLRAAARRKQAGLYRQAEIVADSPVLEGPSVVGEPEQMDVLNGEGHVRRRRAGRQATLMRPRHGHERS